MSKAWLADLEEKVKEAATLLRDLRTENAELRERVSGLESQVEQLEGDLETSRAAGTGDGESSEASAEWSQEREEIRTRVEKLAGHLSELLDSE